MWVLSSILFGIFFYQYIVRRERERWLTRDPFYFDAWGAALDQHLQEFTSVSQ